MSLADLDPWALPSVPLEERCNLPKCPAVYFAIHNKSILYIGRAKNLRNRWRGHHKKEELETYKDFIFAESGNVVIRRTVQIHWLAWPSVEQLPQLETDMRRRFKPLTNGTPFNPYAFWPKNDDTTVRLQAYWGDSNLSIEEIADSEDENLLNDYADIFYEYSEQLGCVYESLKASEAIDAKIAKVTVFRAHPTFTRTYDNEAIQKILKPIGG